MQRFTPRGVVLILILAAALMAATVAAIMPGSRAKVREFLHFDDRKILAKTSGYTSQGGTFVSVFKITSQGMLELEIYTTPDEQGNPRLLQKINLNESRDGYVNFQGNATNLALSDMDGDGSMDILAPTFDEQLTPRLNVFRFNKELTMFERYTPPEEATSTR